MWRSKTLSRSANHWKAETAGTGEKAIVWTTHCYEGSLGRKLSAHLYCIVKEVKGSPIPHAQWDRTNSSRTNNRVGTSQPWLGAHLDFRGRARSLPLPLPQMQQCMHMTHTKDISNTKVMYFYLCKADGAGDDSVG